MDQTQDTQATQGGPGTGPLTTTISGVKVEFPCKPYPSQMAMMSKVITGLKQRKNCLLESPTGSGKSLALLCSALAWQRHEAGRVYEINAEIEARQVAAKQAQAKDRRENERKKQQQQLDGQNRSQFEATASENSISRDKTQQDTDSSFDVSVESSSVPIYDVTDDDDDDFKPAKRTRISTSSSTSLLDKSGNDALNSNAANLQGNTEMKKGPQADLETDSPYFVAAETKLTVPKIIFGTRTHKQIAQITRELRKTNYHTVRSIVLASRDHTCINPTVNKLSNKNEACRELIQNANKGGGCQFHGRSKNLANFQALSFIGLQPAYDLEDLVAVGRKNKACPYYITRFLMQSADIIFCPYNYIIDPVIRKSMSMDLDGHIVIFDEAHNMEDAARESSSFTVKQDELQRSMQDCEKISKYGTEPYAHDEIAALLSKFSVWMDAQSSNLKEKSFNSSGKCWNGTEFLGSAHAAGITGENVQHYEKCFGAITTQRDKQMEEVRERGNRWFEEKPVITVQTVGVIDSIFRLFSELSRDNGRYRDDYRVAMSKDTVRQRANGNSGPFRSVQILSVHLWCLNPAVAFEDIQKAVHSIVLTSGTLSPMQSFESELGAAFPLKLEASHVIDKHQVWAGVIGTGPNGVSLNGSYQNTETLKYQDELGEILYRVCNTMPHGVLCFFPSYRMLDTLCNRWTETKVMARIEKDKVVVKEPRSGPDSFQEAMDTFYEAIDESTKNSGSFTRTGALFLAVYRGKVSEGLDFADNNARAVLCVGIPFPNVRDMQVELKREYNNRNTSRGLLGGGEWYEVQAFRALNQALGRCIRHRKDWGAIFLVDDRYLRTPRYVNSLSKWIRSSVSNYDQWSSCEASLRQFRDRMKALEHPLASDLSNCTRNASSSSCVSSETHGGAHDKGSESWIGMKNDDPNWSGLSSGKETKSVIPFANSFSGYGNAIDSHYFSTDKLASTSNTADSFSSPSGRKENVPNPNFSFKTPVSIFSKKGPSKRTEKPSSIASMFANQLQKNDSTEQQQDKFDPSQVSVSQSETNVPDVGSSEFIISSGQKRGREKKMKL